MLAHLTNNACPGTLVRLLCVCVCVCLSVMWHCPSLLQFISRYQLHHFSCSGCIQFSSVWCGAVRFSAGRFSSVGLFRLQAEGEHRGVVAVQGSLEERLEAAGGVSSNIVEAFRAVLQDSSLDGAFVSAAITLPASTELRDDILHLNPVLLYQVR